MLLVTFTSREPEYTTMARQVVAKAINKTSILASTQSSGRIQVAPHEIVARDHTGMTAKRTMDVYPRRPFYMTIASFGKIDVHLLKHRKFGEVVVDTVHNKERHFSYPSGAHANTNDSCVNAVHYKLTSDRFYKVVEHEWLKKRDQEANV